MRAIVCWLIWSFRVCRDADDNGKYNPEKMQFPSQVSPLPDCSATLSRAQAARHVNCAPSVRGRAPSGRVIAVVVRDVLTLTPFCDAISKKREGGELYMRTSLGILLSVWATVVHANDVDRRTSSDSPGCPGYLGQTVGTTTIVEALAPLGSLAVKGEFETTADFQTRLKSQITGKLDRILIIRKDSEGPSITVVFLI
jgi:hypothetical protein